MNINTIEKYRLNRWYRILLTSRNCILIYNPVCCCLYSNRCIFLIFHRLSKKCICFIAFIYSVFSSTIYIYTYTKLIFRPSNPENSLIRSKIVFWFYVWRALHVNIQKSTQPTLHIHISILILKRLTLHLVWLQKPTH